MLDCDAVYEHLVASGIEMFTGVPDSLLRHFCACVASRAPNHVIAANEGNALAMAVGHQVGTGGLPLVYLQNSGHGNLINPLLSLADPAVYGIPVVLLMGWRGRPGAPTDAVQHHAQGARTQALLAATETPFRVLPDSLDAARRTIDEVCAAARTDRRPVVLLVPEGVFAPWSTSGTVGRPDHPDATLSRERAIEILLDVAPADAVVVSTTGKASRELDALRQRRGEGTERDFLVVGSMGHASSIALGLARSRPDRPIWCLDGDGAAIMHLGALPIIGTTSPPNLTHVLLNNGAHDSVGGQPTVGFDVDLSGIARASGYRSVQRADDEEQLRLAVATLSDQPGPRWLEVNVATGARSDLGRPSTPPAGRLAALRNNLGTPRSEP